jgi:hypothetical protein
MILLLLLALFSLGDGLISSNDNRKRSNLRSQYTLRLASVYNKNTANLLKEHRSFKRLCTDVSFPLLDTLKSSLRRAASLAMVGESVGPREEL